MSDKLSDYQRTCKNRIQQVLLNNLENQNASPELYQAMHYSVMAGGKRIRPILVYATAETVGANLKQADTPACAVELIHTYSLIHDDLPAMDNDDLRRGLPTNHKKFNEATAILAGDALQILAFEILSQCEQITDPQQRVQMIAVMAKASGATGMVAGQMLDLAGENKQLQLSELETIHRLKTGALISASVELGALCSPTVSPKQLSHLKHYAQCIGLSFQIRDDILDIVGDTKTLGKSQGADISRQKATYPALLGMDMARDKAHQLHDEAIQALASFDDKADILRSLSAFIVERLN